VSVSMWRREKEGKGGLAWRRAARGRAETGEARDADRWAWGHNKGRRCQNGLNRFKIQTV
jgi:hypothetical protein